MEIVTFKFIFPSFTLRLWSNRLISKLIFSGFAKCFYVSASLAGNFCMGFLIPHIPNELLAIILLRSHCCFGNWYFLYRKLVWFSFAYPFSGFCIFANIFTGQRVLTDMIFRFLTVFQRTFVAGATLVRVRRLTNHFPKIVAAVRTCSVWTN